MSNDTKNTYKHSEEFRKSFGDRLRGIRKKRGFSIDQAVSSLNIPRSTYSGWELGKRIPLSKSLTELAHLFDTNVNYLMLETNDPSPEDKKDLIELLDVKEILWKGNPISEQQARAIAAIIEGYMKSEAEK